jgi:hypothetical protein
VCHGEHGVRTLKELGRSYLTITHLCPEPYADTYDFETRWDLPFNDYGLGMTAFASPEYALSIPCEFTSVTT